MEQKEVILRHLARDQLSQQSSICVQTLTNYTVNWDFYTVNGRKTTKTFSKPTRFKAAVLNLSNAVPLNTIPHLVVIPNHKTNLLLIRNCNFAIAMSHNVNIYVFLWF